MKNNYISAINKVTASDRLREKTLEAMKQAQNQPVSKTIKFNKKWTVIAACAVFAFCIPAIAYVLDFNSILGTKGAASQMLTSQHNVKAEMTPNEEAGAMPKAAAFDARTIKLTQEQATAMVLEGAAFVEGSTQAGGYETDGIVVNLVTTDEELNAYRFEVTDKNGTQLILYVY